MASWRKATYRVERTHASQRAGAKGMDIVCCNPRTKSEAKLGHYAAVTRTVEDATGQKALAVLARVVVRDDVEDGVVHVDQSLRNALGIPFHFPEDTSVDICPVKVRLGYRLREAVGRLLGRRYLFLRVALSDIPDMEKNVARIPRDALGLLGISPADKVYLIAVHPGDGPYEIERLSLPAYALSDDVRQERRKREKPRLDAQYPQPEGVLGLEEDVLPIYLDSDHRDELGVGLLDVVQVRRDFRHIFLNELREFGIFFISLFALIRVFGDHLSFGEVVLVLVGALTATAVLFLARMRAKSGV